MAVEFWFEFGSTYSYPAALRIEALAQSEGVPIVWKPFLLASSFARKVGAIPPLTSFRRKDVKGANERSELRRMRLVPLR